MGLKISSRTLKSQFGFHVEDKMGQIQVELAGRVAFVNRVGVVNQAQNNWVGCGSGL